MSDTPVAPAASPSSFIATLEAKAKALAASEFATLEADVMSKDSRIALEKHLVELATEAATLVTPFNAAMGAAFSAVAATVTKVETLETDTGL